MKQKTRLDRFITRINTEKSDTIIVVPHINPDPDSLASAYGIKLILENLTSKQIKIVYKGMIIRPENKSFINKVSLPIVRYSVKHEKFPVIMVDSLPDRGNTFIDSKKNNIVAIFDHHNVKETYKNIYTDLRPHYGSTASIIYEYLRAANITITKNTSNIFYYAIMSETRDLGRDVTDIDVKNSIELFPKINKKLVSDIIHPNLPKEHYYYVYKGIRDAEVYKYVLFLNIGNIDIDYIVPYLADFFIVMERITYVLVTGKLDNSMILSIRTQRKDSDVALLLKKVISDVCDTGSSGGHDMVAAGQIPVESVKGYKHLTQQIKESFLKNSTNEDTTKYSSLIPIHHSP